MFICLNYKSKTHHSCCGLSLELSSPLLQTHQFLFPHGARHGYGTRSSTPEWHRRALWPVPAGTHTGSARGGKCTGHVQSPRTHFHGHYYCLYYTIRSSTAGNTAGLLTTFWHPTNKCGKNLQHHWQQLGLSHNTGLNVLHWRLTTQKDSFEYDPY